MTHRVLMCPPTYLPELAADRSWTTTAGQLDQSLALDQWHQLRAIVDEHVAPVSLLPPSPWTPAQAFTRDLAVMTKDRLVLLMAHRARGPFEAPLAHRFLREHGYSFPDDRSPLRLDGGNVLVDAHGRLLIGVTSAENTDAITPAVRKLAALTDMPAHRVPIAGGRFPHLDMALCDLGGKAWLAYPKGLSGFDPADPDWKTLLLGKPVITAEPANGQQLACNLIVANGSVVGPEISDDLTRQIEAFGFTYLATPLSEFLKAGGGAHCLTLELPHPST